MSYESILLGVVGPEVPDLIAEVPTEEAPTSSALFLLIKQPTRGEVVSATIDGELLVGGEVLDLPVLQVHEAVEYVLGDALLQQSRTTSLSLSLCQLVHRRVSTLCERQL